MVNQGTNQALRYCLYARKSSEQDERQALSIDAQVSEMKQLAARDGLAIVAERHESHSAKDSGQRPEFNGMLDDIRDGRYEAVLTWAPDRLSRNGGDLGRLVDLMDQGRLVEIRTPSQKFSNVPGEKFLLMILCSTAKLENDNKSVNVKRGLNAKVKMGYRPNMAPLGYLHDKYAPKGEKRVKVDPVRAPIIKEAFRKVEQEGWTGRDLKRWMDNDVAFTTRHGKKITLSMVYRTMSNVFYTGRFEFPIGSGNWFDGKHDPLVTKATFDRVQEIMKGKPHGAGPKKEFAFTRMIRCGGCGAGITAEEKRKRLKDGSLKRYVYYGCGNKWASGCKQKYIREEELMRQLCEIIDLLDIDSIAASKGVTAEVERMKSLSIALGDKHLTKQLSDAIGKFDIHSYAKYVLKNGTRDDRRTLLDGLKSRLMLSDCEVSLA